MNSYIQKELLYEGKAKSVYAVKDQKDICLIHFTDKLTALNGKKQGGFTNKGGVNRDISSYIFNFLISKNIKTHWLADIKNNSMICKRLQIIFLEVIVRNTLAGSTAKKLGLKEGEQILSKPLVELYYKNDKLNDPFLNDEQALFLQLCDQSTLCKMKELALEINRHLKGLFLKAKICLVDFKLEFGFNELKDIVLADEISPDSCRLWDIESKKKMDKDRFRRDLGEVEQNYKEVLSRLKNI